MGDEVKITPAWDLPDLGILGLLSPSIDIRALKCDYRVQEYQGGGLPELRSRAYRAAKSIANIAEDDLLAFLNAKDGDWVKSVESFEYFSGTKTFRILMGRIEKYIRNEQDEHLFEVYSLAKGIFCPWHELGRYDTLRNTIELFAREEQLRVA